jgi:hypothetical protein
MEVWLHRSLSSALDGDDSVDDIVINEHSAVSSMSIGRGNGSTQREPTAFPPRPPQIPHDLTWDRTRSTVLGSQRLTS